MNPIQTTPPQNPDVDEETGHDDPLDNLLTQIINGFFVLTDGQGAVSKWSEPAELLFGLDAAEVLGKSLFDTLVDYAPPEARGVAALPRERRGADHRGVAAGQRDLRGRQAQLPARDGLHPGQARRGLRLLALPRGPLLRAAAQPDADAHAPAAPGRGARDAPGARARAPAVGRLAHGGHARRVPPDRSRRRGSRRRSPPARPRAPPRTSRARSASIPIPASRATRSPTSTTPPPSSPACCPRWSASRTWRRPPPTFPSRSRRPAARRRPAATAPRRPSRRSTRRASSSSASATRSAPAEDPAERRGAARAHHPPGGRASRRIPAEREELLERIGVLEETLAEDRARGRGSWSASPSSRQASSRRVLDRGRGAARAHPRPGAEPGRGIVAAQGEELLERISGLEANLAEASATAAEELLERISGLEAEPGRGIVDRRARGAAGAHRPARGEPHRRIVLDGARGAAGAHRPASRRALAEAESSTDREELLERISGFEASLAEASSTADRVGHLEASLAEDASSDGARGAAGAPHPARAEL